MERDKCILCGKSAEDSVKWAYFERGISEKLFLCDTCHSHKVNLLDFNIDEEMYAASKFYMETQMEGKVAEIRNVVTAWIDGEGYNYFPESADLMYYVEGLEAYLFVFKDRVVILSSKVDLSYTMMDASSFRVKTREREKRYDCTLDQCIVLCNDKRRSEVATYKHWSLAEIKESNYQNATEHIRTDYTLDEEKPIDLDVSFGEYGKLIFNYSGYMVRGSEDTFLSGQAFTFRFFYHQNQLMEEIYNYIQHCLALAREESEGNVKPKQKMIATGAKRMQVKEGTEANAGVSLADEISKLKGLLDCGVLTQEEFDEAKKKLIAKL